jgi:hypothetical protein
MRKANYAVDGKGETPSRAARELEKEIGVP